MIVLGNSYYHGNSESQDFTKAVKWYRKAAEQSNAKAIRLIGRATWETIKGAMS
jgi:TPR repeat protein